MNSTQRRNDSGFYEIGHALGEMDAPGDTTDEKVRALEMDCTTMGVYLALLNCVKNG